MKKFVVVSEQCAGEEEVKSFASLDLVDAEAAATAAEEKFHGLPRSLAVWKLQSSSWDVNSYFSLS